MDNSNIIEFLRKNLLLLFAIPIILIGFIYIQYGDIFNNYFFANNEMEGFCHLHTHLVIFSSDINLPCTVKNIGHFATVFIYLIFGIWLVSCLLSTYIHLSKQTASIIDILCETALLFICYFIFIMPGLNIWFSIVGVLLITTILVLLFLYWNYERMVSNEKK